MLNKLDTGKNMGANFLFLIHRCRDNTRKHNTLLSMAVVDKIINNRLNACADIFNFMGQRQSQK